MTIFSKPADPNAVSLLKLPGEIRNVIYEELFVRDQRVRVVDGHAHFPGVSILATCQQIASEATPFLYSRNTFVLSVSNLPEWVCHPCDEGFVFEAGKWLRQLGGQIAHLELVLIETSEYYWKTQIDVYPILPYICDSANTRLMMEFLPPTDTLPMLTPFPKFQIGDMNRALAALSSTKAKHIRAYGQFPRLASSISIYTSKSGGFIKLNMSQNAVPNVNWNFSQNLNFYITADGDCTLEQPQLESGIWKIFRNLRLMDYFLRITIISSDEIPRYDLDKLLAYPVLPALTQSHWHWNYSFLTILRQNEERAMATLTSRSVEMYHKKLVALDRLEDLNIVSYRSFEWPPPRILELSFMIGKHNSLQDIRIDATALVSLMEKYAEHTEIHVKLMDNDADFALNSRGEFKLRDIRYAVTDLLHHLCKRSANSHVPCPDIWVDGTGTLFEAIAHAGTDAAQSVYKGLVFSKRLVPDNDLAQTPDSWSQVGKSHVPQASRTSGEQPWRTETVEQCVRMFRKRNYG
ncbi:hypothetical protein FB567DRAFT_576873 [Paraphoma chrysanthemicola]|uniref:Uncharacterized protein n=1 Tax=Paraphoma chrysanthemicola TaxID=798071 RepID=A0A8K0W2Y6_9PLEO|nr:hypothetical protein FB567DRAFT_576873 [Paraphoma chrysanthemicola]